MFERPPCWRRVNADPSPGGAASARDAPGFAASPLERGLDGFDGGVAVLDNFIPRAPSNLLNSTKRTFHVFNPVIYFAAHWSYLPNGCSLDCAARCASSASSKSFRSC